MDRDYHELRLSWTEITPAHTRELSIANLTTRTEERITILNSLGHFENKKKYARNKTRRQREKNIYEVEIRTPLYTISPQKQRLNTRTGEKKTYQAAQRTSSDRPLRCQLEPPHPRSNGFQRSTPLVPKGRLTAALSK